MGQGVTAGVAVIIAASLPQSETPGSNWRMNLTVAARPQVIRDVGLSQNESAVVLGPI